MIELMTRTPNANFGGMRGLAPNEKQWQAVQRRDRGADGAFVYAVRSTGIYCRPSCPSRKPRREQVEFFPLPEAAEQKGFRACLRCRPRLARLRDPRTAAVARVCREIEAQIDADSSKSANGDASDARMTLSSLSSAAGMSALKSRLRKGDDVTTALYDAGFGSSSRLYERAPAQLGMTPATYRQGGAGMRIRYTIAGSPLGRLLVGATDRGISALYLGESDARLEAAIQKEYPRAEIRRDRNGMESWIEQILAHLRGRAPHLDLPTDVQATAFQRRVWEELRRIPYGKTKTYSEVARAIGRPTAVRAVARACATNPVSVVVPCHRVVREDGNLAGYRWGVERKLALLQHESASRAEKKQRKAVK